MKQEILECLNTKWIGRDLHYYASTGSTNQDAMRLLEDGAKEGVLVVAGAQDFGKGRRGRVWQSPPDVNVYMTLGLCPDYAPDLAPMTTLIMAMAVVRAIEDCCKLQCQIKWPNDVVINGKKICGILTEMSLTAEKAPHVVIGVGINVNETDFPEEIQQTATSLYLERGDKVSRSVMIAKTMEYFEIYYEKFFQTKDMSLLKQEYVEKLVNAGAVVRVLDPQGEFEGVAKGIDNRGQLLVQTENGSIEAVYAGEVSVRGVYGYV